MDLKGIPASYALYHCNLGYILCYRKRTGTECNHNLMDAADGSIAVQGRFIFQTNSCHRSIATVSRCLAIHDPGESSPPDHPT